jgi:hypothetical protein
VNARAIRLRALLTAALACGMTSIAGGQQPANSPHAGYIYPAGGQRGTAISVKVGGQYLEGASAILVSGRGVHASVERYDRPLTQRDVTDLRDKLQELQKQSDVAGRQRELADLRLQIGDAVRRLANPALADSVVVNVAIDRDADPGPRQLRVQTPLGVSDAVLFSIGQFPEFREKDDKAGPEDAETFISLPATVNGRLIPGDIERRRFPLRQAPQYMPADVDRYRFIGRKGEHLVAIVSARDLRPFLADAVPGWFQATAAIFDAAGRELAYDDDYRFHPDPVLQLEIPADGEYVLEIKDALYRGREDFVYRIAIGELPFLTSIFPLGGPIGAVTNVTPAGWTLPVATLKIRVDDQSGGLEFLSTRRGDVQSNRVPFAADTLPERLEREPDNSFKTAQSLTLPVIVNGRIDHPGDWDLFAFRGRAGERIAADVLARRLDSPLDSVLELTDAAGRRVAFNDDHPEQGSPLVHQADSLLIATLPANGLYVLRLGDVQHKGGPEYAYRLRVSAPRPDFQLRVTPAAINVSGGGTVPLTITALRTDGFAGEIDLALAGNNHGAVLSGGLVPAGQSTVRATLTVPFVSASQVLTVQLEGRAQIDGRIVVRRAVPADDMMQAFFYHHLVPADELRLAIMSRGAVRVPARLDATAPIALTPGGSARVGAVVAPSYRSFADLQCEALDPPAGITLGGCSLEPTGLALTIRANAGLAVGTRGNLIVTLSGERVVPPDSPAASQPRRRVMLGTLPAIAFVIAR